MRYFPIFVDMDGRRVLVVGGGEAAAQKVRLLARTPAGITVVAGDPVPELVALSVKGRLDIIARAFCASDVGGHHFVYAASGDASLDARVAATARARGIPVNVVDSPQHCTFLTPAIVDRTPLTVAIGSEGTAPVLARVTRHRIEAMLPARLGALSAWAGGLRERIGREVEDGRLRRHLWQRLMTGPVAASVLAGDRRGAEAQLETEIATLGREAPSAGRVALVGAGPGDPDLLTLKALQALEQADVLVVDRLVDPSILDRARRDAERIFVGKAPGGPATDQRDINRILVREARKGKFVVRLKGGDPLVFARASEEMAALQRAGTPFEIVPGITAAQGAAAALHLPLTERGRGRSVALLAGATADGRLDHDWDALARGAETFAVYMGVRNAPEIRRNLLAAGMAPETPVVIAENATRADQRAIATTLDDLARSILCNGITGPAILFFRADWQRSGLARPASVERVARRRAVTSPASLELTAG